MSRRDFSPLHRYGSCCRPERMKWLSCIVVVVVGCSTEGKRGPSAPVAAVANPPHGAVHEMTGHHHDGDRTGLHGMTLFGHKHHFLEHIPMFRRPHNEQVVMRV